MDQPSFTGRNRKVTPEMARQIMDDHPDYVLLDVRTPEEYAWAYIEGATLIPLESLAREVETRLPDKETFILAYCHLGVRSAEAIAMLSNMGYGNTYDIGGIVQWPYGTVKGGQ